MGLLSFTIETEQSPDEIIDLVRGVSNTSSLTKKERMSIIRAFPASHWPIPNALSTHPDYQALISFSKKNRTIYLGLIVPCEGGGSKVIFGMDWRLLTVVIALLFSLIFIGLSKMPNINMTFALSAGLFLFFSLFLIVKHSFERHRRLVYKALVTKPATAPPNPNAKRRRLNKVILMC